MSGQVQWALHPLFLRLSPWAAQPLQPVLHSVRQAHKAKQAWAVLLELWATLGLQQPGTHQTAWVRQFLRPRAGAWPIFRKRAALKWRLPVVVSPPPADRLAGLQQAHKRLAHLLAEMATLARLRPLAATLARLRPLVVALARLRPPVVALARLRPLVVALARLRPLVVALARLRPLVAI